MRKVILMILVGYSSLMCYSQETNNRAIGTDDTYCFQWVYLGEGEGEYTHKGVAFDFVLSNYIYEKNGKTYQMVYSSADAKERVPLPDCHRHREMLGIREEGGRVYVNQQEYEALFETDHLNFVGDKNYIPYEKTTDGELVIYDYNMQVGDKYPHVEGHEDITVVSVETMMTQDGVSRRLLTLNNGYKLLEGVGCLNSPGLFFFYLNPILWEFHNKAQLTICGYIENETNVLIVVYSERDVTGVGRQLKASNFQSDIVYDLYGRNLNSRPLKGIVIQNGKKKLVK